MTDIVSEIQKWSDTTVVDNQLCRLCLSITDLLIPIFEGEGIEQELFKKIKKYLPVKVSPSDSLPQQICYLCAGTLVAWNSLYSTCIKTNEKLHLLLLSTENENKDSDDLEDEPLSPLKKRKSVKDKDESEALNCDKTKVGSQKKSKKLCKSEDKMSNSEKSQEKNICEESSNNSDDLAETTTGTLLTEIKVECDSEKEETVNNDKTKDSNESLETGLIKCEFCKKSYKDKKCLSRHMKKFHDEVKTAEAQKCDLCGNIYKTRANLERHYMKEHLTNQVPCPVCHASFNSKKLDFHLKSAHGVKTESENEDKFKCKMCDRWFKNKYVRNSHVKEAHLSEPMKCKLCDFEGVRTVLRRHKRDVHAEKRFLCSLCPGAFKTLHTLKMHMTSHSDVRCYTCDICGMGFKRLNNVRDHMKCHQQKSNQCQICGNFFARKRYLAIHEKTIHNFYADGIIPEEKGFECGTCGAKLKWKKNLLAHMRIHTGEKPYVCKICNKDFICHGSLRTHMAKHSVRVLNEGDSQNQLPVEVNVFNHFTTNPV